MVSSVHRLFWFCWVVTPVFAGRWPSGPGCSQIFEASRFKEVDHDMEPEIGKSWRERATLPKTHIDLGGFSSTNPVVFRVHGIVFGVWGTSTPAPKNPEHPHLPTGNCGSQTWRMPCCALGGWRGRRAWQKPGGGCHGGDVRAEYFRRFNIYIYIYILAIEYLKCLKRIEMYRVFYRLFLGGAQRFPRACGPGPF